MKTKQQDILKEAVKLAPFEGWNTHTLEKAALAAGLDKGYEQIAFTGGIADLVDYFIRHLDDKMLKKAAKNDILKMKIRERIPYLVKCRLEESAEYKSALRKTVSYYTNPINAAEGTKSLWKTVDCMWYAAGDDASDFNYYTKRMTLAAVYSSTLLYWLKDDSENHQKTWEFLDRRIGNVMSFHKTKAKFSDILKR